MKLTLPYIDENKQVIFIEFENDMLHNLVNGGILGFLTVGIMFLLFF